MHFDLALRSESGVHLRFWRSVVTLDILVYVLVVTLAALLWTFSSLSMLFCVYGSQTELLYSSAGLTYVLYSCSLIFGPAVRKFL